MELQLLPFEESMKLKEIGFDWPTSDYFLYIKAVGHDGFDYFEKTGETSNYNEQFGNHCSRPTLDLACKWFRDVHGVYVTPYRESIGSDEWVYCYRLEYLPKEFEDYKRRAIHWVTKESFVEGPGSYSGGWYTWEEAQLHGLREAIDWVSKNSRKNNNKNT